MIINGLLFGKFSPNDWPSHYAMSHWDKYLFCINISLGCQNAVFLIHAERFNSKRRLSFENVFELN